MYGDDGLLAQISAELIHTEQQLNRIFSQCSDYVFRPLRIFGCYPGFLVYMDGLVDLLLVDQVILKPLMYDSRPESGISKPFTSMLEEAISVGQAKQADTLDQVTDGILYGNAAVFVDGHAGALLFDVKGWKTRNIEEPESESVIRGPREGFNETVRTGTSLLRRRLRTPSLKLESFHIGSLSRTEVVLAYLDGVAPSSVVQEVRNRLGRMKIDGVLESGYIEETIEDAPYSPFPTILSTERPDVVTANLLEGRVALLTDNTPFALLAPITFWDALNTNEDYYQRYWIGTLIRWIRYFCVVITLILPAFYLSIVSYHQEMIPSVLLLSIASSRENTPLPALLEVLLMEFTFEVLREAGLRLPKQIGQAVSIVGALVIGQSAVEAGIISAPMIIIVAFTGICSFAIPRFSLGVAVRILRFPLIVIGGVFGLYGLTIGVLFILLHLCSLRSLGVPYFAPVAPLALSNLKDVLIRAPWWSMHRKLPSHSGREGDDPH